MSLTQKNIEALFGVSPNAFTVPTLATYTTEHTIIIGPKVFPDCCCKQTSCYDVSECPCCYHWWCADCCRVFRRVSDDAGVDNDDVLVFCPCGKDIGLLLGNRVFLNNPLPCINKYDLSFDQPQMFHSHHFKKINWKFTTIADRVKRSGAVQRRRVKPQRFQPY
jgi:hypothetical protein